jgi:phospholipid/cholesterol/gamma-HCH transport system substrate-binding protein
MRRLAATALLVLAAAAGGVVATAGADDSHTYTIELDNAFGIVKGSEVRIAGVNQGEVTDLDINDQKRALITVTVAGPLAQLGADTECSSEPQSLIAEYFIDCQPQGEPIPTEEEGSTTEPNIPVEQTTQTVQADLVQNTLREPFKRRLQLIINEFGTALAGNPENLNDAVRRGAPALRQLEEALDILGDQNTIIRDLNANSDRIIARLAERRDDVVKFIKEARDTAAASAERRQDLAADFDLLDNFLAELQPTMVELGDLAEAQTPLLVDLRAAAPQLNELAVSLPAFNEATDVSLDSLGEAAVVGRKALRKGRDEIKQLRRTAKKAPDVALYLADLLRDLDDPRRAVEIDQRAGRDTGRTSTAPGSSNTMGYTGLEGLLNYVYYQAGSLNQYDAIGHSLHISLFSVEGPCGEYSTGHEPGSPDFGVPNADDSDHTTDVTQANDCVAWLGPNQPGISQPINVPPYDNSVCPNGSTNHEICDPGVSTDSARGGNEIQTTGEGNQVPGYQPPASPEPGGQAPGAPGLDLPGNADDNLDDLLDIPGVTGEGGALDQNGGGGDQATGDLLDFLFSN